MAEQNNWKALITAGEQLLEGAGQQPEPDGGPEQTEHPEPEGARLDRLLLNNWPEFVSEWLQLPHARQWTSFKMLDRERLPYLRKHTFIDLLKWAHARLTGTRIDEPRPVEDETDRPIGKAITEEEAAWVGLRHRIEKDTGFIWSGTWDELVGRTRQILRTFFGPHFELRIPKPYHAAAMTAAIYYTIVTFGKFDEDHPTFRRALARAAQEIYPELKPLRPAQIVSLLNTIEAAAGLDKEELIPGGVDDVALESIKEADPTGAVAGFIGRLRVASNNWNDRGAIAAALSQIRNRAHKVVRSTVLDGAEKPSLLDVPGLTQDVSRALYAAHLGYYNLPREHALELLTEDLILELPAGELVKRLQQAGFRLPISAQELKGLQNFTQLIELLEQRYAEEYRRRTPYQPQMAERVPAELRARPGFVNEHRLLFETERERGAASWARAQAQTVVGKLRELLRPDAEQRWLTAKQVLDKQLDIQISEEDKKAFNRAFHQAVQLQKIKEELAEGGLLYIPFKILGAIGEVWHRTGVPDLLNYLRGGREAFFFIRPTDKYLDLAPILPELRQVLREYREKPIPVGALTAQLIRDLFGYDAYMDHLAERRLNRTDHWFDILGQTFEQLVGFGSDLVAMGLDRPIEFFLMGRALGDYSKTLKRFTKRAKTKYARAGLTLLEPNPFSPLKAIGTLFDREVIEAGVTRRRLKQLWSDPEFREKSWHRVQRIWGLIEDQKANVTTWSKLEGVRHAIELLKSHFDTKKRFGAVTDERIIDQLIDNLHDLKGASPHLAALITDAILPRQPGKLPRVADITTGLYLAQRELMAFYRYLHEAQEELDPNAPPPALLMSMVVDAYRDAAQVGVRQSVLGHVANFLKNKQIAPGLAEKLQAYVERGVRHLDKILETAPVLRDWTGMTARSAEILREFLKQKNEGQQIYVLYDLAEKLLNERIERLNFEIERRANWSRLLMAEDELGEEASKARRAYEQVVRYAKSWELRLRRLREKIKGDRQALEAFKQKLARELSRLKADLRMDPAEWRFEDLAAFEAFAHLQRFDSWFRRHVGKLTKTEEIDQALRQGVSYFANWLDEANQRAEEALQHLQPQQVLKELQSLRGQLNHTKELLKLVRTNKLEIQNKLKRWEDWYRNLRTPKVSTLQKNIMDGHEPAFTRQDLVVLSEILHPLYEAFKNSDRLLDHDMEGVWGRIKDALEGLEQDEYYRALSRRYNELINGYKATLTHLRKGALGAAEGEIRRTLGGRIKQKSHFFATDFARYLRILRREISKLEARRNRRARVFLSKTLPARQIFRLEPLRDRAAQAVYEYINFIKNLYGRRLPIHLLPQDLLTFGLLRPGNFRYALQQLASEINGYFSILRDQLWEIQHIFRRLSPEGQQFYEDALRHGSLPAERAQKLSAQDRALLERLGARFKKGSPVRISLPIGLNAHLITLAAHLGLVPPELCKYTGGYLGNFKITNAFARELKELGAQETRFFFPPQPITKPAYLRRLLNTQQMPHQVRVFYEEAGELKIEEFPLERFNGSAKEAKAAARAFVQRLLEERRIKSRSHAIIVDAMPPEKAARLGIITDSAELSFSATQKLIRDLARHTLFDHIAHMAGLVRRDLEGVAVTERGEWIKVPDKAHWGRLAGRYVHRNVIKTLDYLDQHFDYIQLVAEEIYELLGQDARNKLQNFLSKTFRSRLRPLAERFTRFLKIRLILQSIGTFFNNFIGNVFFATLAGVNPLSPKIWEYFREFDAILEKDILVESLTEGARPFYRPTIFPLTSFTLADEFREFSARYLVPTLGSLETNYLTRVVGKNWKLRNFLNYYREMRENECLRLQSRLRILEKTRAVLDAEIAKGNMKVAEHLQLVSQLQWHLRRQLAKNAWLPWIGRELFRAIAEGLIFDENLSATARLLSHIYGRIDPRWKWAAYRYLTKDCGLPKAEAFLRIDRYFQNYHMVRPWVRQLSTKPLVGAFVPSFAAEAARICKEAIKNHPTLALGFLLAPLYFNAVTLSSAGYTFSDMMEWRGNNFFETLRDLLFSVYIPLPGGQLWRFSMAGSHPMSPLFYASGFLGASDIGTRLLGTAHRWLGEQGGDIMGSLAEIGVGLFSQFYANTPLVNLGAKLFLNIDPYNRRQAFYYKDPGSFFAPGMLRAFYELLAPRTLYNVTEALTMPRITSNITRHERPLWMELINALAPGRLAKYKTSEALAVLILRHYKAGMILESGALPYSPDNPGRKLAELGAQFQTMLKEGEIDEAIRTLRKMYKISADRRRRLIYLAGRPVILEPDPEKVTKELIRRATRNARHLAKEIPVSQLPKLLVEIFSQPWVPRNHPLVLILVNRLANPEMLKQINSPGTLLMALNDIRRLKERIGNEHLLAIFDVASRAITMRLAEFLVRRHGGLDFERLANDIGGSALMEYFINQAEALGLLGGEVQH